MIVGFRTTVRTSDQEQATKHTANSDGGLTNSNNKKYEEARALFRAAAEADPKNAEYKINLAWAIFRDAKFDRQQAKEAPALLEEGLRLTEDRVLLATAHYYLGRIHLTSDRPDEALKHFNAALKMQPKHAEAGREVRLSATPSRSRHMTTSIPSLSPTKRPWKGDSCRACPAGRWAGPASHGRELADTR